MFGEERTWIVLCVLTIVVSVEVSAKLATAKYQDTMKDPSWDC
jgi:hypothetical protein